MIRTVCTACEMEIDVPTAGRNTCPACGHETVCFAPPDPLARLLPTIIKVARVQGFRAGFYTGVLLAVAAYWAGNLLAKYLP